MNNDKNEIENNIKSIARKLGLSDLKITIENSNKCGRMGAGLDVQLIGCKNNRIETHNFYVKLAPDSPKERQTCPIEECFQREIIAYTEIIPLLESIQKEIKNFNKVKFVRYFASSARSNEFLIFEKINGFVSITNTKRDNALEEIYAVIKNIGKLHGLSMVLKARSPGKFNSLLEKCDEVYLGERYKNDQHVFGFKNMIDLIFRITNEYLEGEEKEFNEYIKGLAFEMTQKAVNDCDYKVICHGDCHLGNFLFEYENSDRSIIKDSRMLDFQLLNFSSPASDFQCLIGSKTSKEMRQKHYESFTELHYSTMAETLKLFSMDIEDLYPKKMYQKDLENCSIIAIFKANQAFVFGLGKPNNEPTLSDYFSGVLKKEQLRTEAECVEDIQWVRESIGEFMVRWGHLYN